MLPFKPTSYPRKKTSPPIIPRFRKFTGSGETRPGKFSACAVTNQCQKISGWWLNQPIWKICSPKWESSPSKTIFETTTYICGCRALPVVGIILLFYQHLPVGMLFETLHRGGIVLAFPGRFFSKNRDPFISNFFERMSPWKGTILKNTLPVFFRINRWPRKLGKKNMSHVTWRSWWFNKGQVINTTPTHRENLRADPNTNEVNTNGPLLGSSSPHLPSLTWSYLGRTDTLAQRSYTGMCQEVIVTS